MPALEIRPEEIGVYDYARHKAIRDKLWAIKAPVASPRLSVRLVAIDDSGFLPIKLRGVRAPRVEWMNSIEAYGQKDRTFDLGADGAFRPKRIRKTIQMHDIARIVTQTYGLGPTDLRSHRRTHEVCRPRQEAFWLCKKFTTKSLPEIGREFGGKDHTTILHGVRRMNELIESGEYVPHALPRVEEAVAETARGHDPAAACVEG